MWCWPHLCWYNAVKSIAQSNWQEEVSGLAGLLTLVVYISSFTQEVGKKLYPPSPMEDPLFHYRYGSSFYCAVASFVCVELAAVLSLSVYMAKHDEDMANRYHIRNLFKVIKILSVRYFQQRWIRTGLIVANSPAIGVWIVVILGCGRRANLVFVIRVFLVFWWHLQLKLPLSCKSASAPSVLLWPDL